MLKYIFHIQNTISLNKIYNHSHFPVELLIVHPTIEIAEKCAISPMLRDQLYMNVVFFSRFQRGRWNLSSSQDLDIIPYRHSAFSTTFASDLRFFKPYKLLMFVRQNNNFEKCDDLRTFQAHHHLKRPNSISSETNVFLIENIWVEILSTHFFLLTTIFRLSIFFLSKMVESTWP